MQTVYSGYQKLDDLCSEFNWNLAAEDQKWTLAASKLAFEARTRGEVVHGNGNRVGSVRRTLSEPAGSKVANGKPKQKGGGEARRDATLSQFSADWKFNGMSEHPWHLNARDQSHGSQNLDKRFKSLPQAEILPRSETLGGYIFVCNNDTMQEDLKRQLFGLPRRYRDSVRAIQPGLPLFLYNYTTHQLHGIFEAASFGGSNIDPSAWEDKKCKGESRFPAQVRSRVRRICKPLEEDSFRPILHHYDGPKFRLQLSVPETLALLDLFNDGGSV